MRKLSLFNRTLWKSLFSFRYYHDVVAAPFNFSFKFFLAFSMFLGIIITISLGLAIYSPVQQFTNRFKERAYALYPQDLIITTKDGKLTTNATEPYHFSIPFELFLPQAPAISDEKQKYLVTIDTKANPGAYDESQSIFLVTRDSLVVPENTEDFRVIPLQELDDVTINKANTDAILKNLLPVVHLLFPTLMIFAGLVLFIIWPIARLLSLVIFAFMILPFTKLMGLELPYKKIFQIMLHSYLLPFFIETALFLFGLQPPISFFNLLLFILYNLIIFAELKSQVLNKMA